MASNETDQVERPGYFQHLEDADLLDFPEKSIPEERYANRLANHQSRAVDSQSTRAQSNMAQGSRVQSNRDPRDPQTQEDPQEPDKPVSSTELPYHDLTKKYIRNNDPEENNVCKRLSNLTKINFRSVKSRGLY